MRMRLVGLGLGALLVVGLMMACSLFYGPESTPSADPDVAPEFLPVTGDEDLEALVPVESISLNVVESLPTQVSVTVYGHMPDDCTRVGSITQAISGNRILITLAAEHMVSPDCGQEPVYYEQTVLVNVEGLAPGRYSVDVNGVAADLDLGVDTRGYGLDTYGCLSAAEGQVRYLSLDGGYCLLYPTRYGAQWSEPRQLVLYSVGGDEQAVGVRMTITRVGSAGGRPAHDLVSDALEMAGVHTVSCTVTFARLDGEQMVVAEGGVDLPWQRLAHVVHDDVLYALELSPIDPSQDQGEVDAEMLWMVVTSSFRFFRPSPIGGGYACEQQREWSVPTLCQAT
ncbi:MAG: hypothetical protein ACYC5M_15860 [Anaerolineae bacterium]